MSGATSAEPGRPPPLPDGFRIELDADTKQLGGGWLFGGSPARAMRLSTAGLRAFRELQDGPVRSPATGLLARRLVDAGLAHPVPPADPHPADVTVVIPAYERAAALADCLTALGGRYPVLVVDDGTRNPGPIADVCRQHGARLVRRDRNGGPAAARNSALAYTYTSALAFLDSDCVPASDWIDRLAGHLADPAVAAVAPRVVPVAADGWAGQYTRAHGSLDLGGRPARVAPGTRVAYVPTAALLVRRAALDDLAAAGPVFDPALRVGEDVDLVWRLHRAGWSVRYEPAVRLGHAEPRTMAALLRRRFRYGTSAAPLANRHPGSLAPLVLHAWPALAVGAGLLRRPAVAATAFATSVVSMRATLRRAGVPEAGVTSAMGTALGQTWLGIGRYATQFASPVLAAGVLAPARGRRRGWWRRAAAASLLLGPPVVAWCRDRPRLDLPRFAAAWVADDVAYGAGVWAGCRRERTLRPVLPRVAVRALKVGADEPRAGVR